MLQELRNLFESGGYAVYGLLVQEEGETVLALGDCTARHPVYSAAKSFTATAAGMLQDAGEMVGGRPAGRPTCRGRRWIKCRRGSGRHSGCCPSPVS